jgi:hypothetical protein
MLGRSTGWRGHHPKGWMSGGTPTPGTATFSDRRPRDSLIAHTESPIGAVIESNLYRSVAVDSLGRLPGALVEVFYRCDQAVAHTRCQDRAGTRHAGHFDAVRTVEELWNNEVAEPVAGGWPVLEVDTNAHVDVAEVLAFVRRSIT